MPGCPSVGDKCTQHLKQWSARTVPEDLATHQQVTQQNWHQDQEDDPEKE